LLKDKKIKISMTENGHPLENDITERVNRILKKEYTKENYNSFDEAQRSVAKTVAIYNSLRPHSKCEMKITSEAHQTKGELKRRWKNYYKKKDVAISPWLFKRHTAHA
jgi:transposase InsO family protein